MFLLLLIFFLIYFSVAVALIFKWVAIPTESVKENNFNNFISVIVPVRNEEKNISNVLESLKKQLYPADCFEIIIVDDHSEDSTGKIVNRILPQIPNLRLLKLNKIQPNVYGKKRAIEFGVSQARGTLIAQTDADCLAPSNWLSQANSFYNSTKVKLIAGPVCLPQSYTLLQNFQQAELLVLALVTGVSVNSEKAFLCNGANLIYEKSAFEAVEGFKGVDNIASGDDVFLLQKIKSRFGANAIQFLKHSQFIVHTNPLNSVSELLQQRVRWASKVFYFLNPTNFLVALFVVLSNIFFFMSLAYVSLFNMYSILPVLFKIGADFLLVFSVAKFYEKKISLPLFIINAILYLPYSILITLASFSIKNNTWKGRPLK